MKKSVLPTIATLAALIREIKKDVSPEFRASDDPDDDTPAILLTVGADGKGRNSWSWQTGDNSYSGGAYGYRAWGLGYVTKTCNSREVAKGILDEIAESLSY